MEKQAISTSANNNSGKKAERRQVLRAAAILSLVVVSIEWAALGYLIYVLGLHVDGRWVIIIKHELFFTALLIPPVGFLCVKWAREVIEFGRIVLSGERPTSTQSADAIKSVYRFAHNGAIVFVAFYEFFLIVSAVGLYFLSGFSAVEALSVLLYKGVACLNIGIVVYYSIKIIEHYRVKQAMTYLLEDGIYDWSHPKFRIRNKIFLIILVVVAYLLSSAVFMGLAQAVDVQKTRIGENLEYWTDGLKNYLHSTYSGGAGEVAKQPAYFISDELSPDSRMFLLTMEGKVMMGEVSDDGAGDEVSANGETTAKVPITLNPKDIEKIVSGGMNGKIVDYLEKKIVVYKKSPDYDLIIAGVGKWGMATSAYSKIRTSIVALLVATLLLTVVATFLLVNDINRPLTRALKYLRATARGEMVKKLDAYSEDEVGILVRELAQTTDLLEFNTRHSARLVERITSANASIENNAAIVNVASEEQAAGIHEQAGAIEEALSASNEIVATSREIAQNAHEVYSLAEQNKEICRRGDMKVGEAVERFTQVGVYIGEISGKILALGEDIRAMTGVMEVIEEVAVQIGLLALNAQIESGQAGESGLRFTVVAEEIRRLADNTMDVVGQIGEMIEGTLASAENVVAWGGEGEGLVRKGSELSESIREAFRKIENDVDVTLDTARVIADITDMQKTASQQMSQTMSGINASARQIKNNADDILASMRSLLQTSMTLSETLRK